MVVVCPHIEIMFNKKSLSREEGQGLVEYALILVLVAVVVIAVLMLLGPQINQAFCQVANVLQRGTCGVISTVQASRDAGVSSNARINVTVSEETTVTVAVDGKGSQDKNCTPSSCPEFTFSNVSAGTGFTVTAPDGSKFTGTF